MSKKAYRESSRQSWSRIVSEVESHGPLRTDITLVDMWGEKPGKIIYYYKFNICGEVPKNGALPSPNLCYGYISESRYRPLAHVIQDIDHDIFVMIAEKMMM